MYDNLDRVSKIYQTENNTESLVYEMIYNGEGDLYEIRNYRTGRASFFEYDHAGRCMASKERSFTAANGVISYGGTVSSYGYKYDKCSNLTKLTCSVAGSTWSTVYTYDGDNRAKTTTLSSGKIITNTYDALGRLASRKIGLSSNYITTLTYVPGNAANKTTGLVASYQNGSDAAYTYAYDDVGNITGITQGSTSITYEYDAANRLARENNQVTNQTVTYEYDTWGNILIKKIYACTTGDLTNETYTQVDYAYTNTAWGDQLTSYDNTAITYDGMGNPLTYRGYTFGWRGKQLTTASNGTNSLTFEYNEDGLRQKKTVNNVDTDYFYNGSVLIGMQKNTDKLLFSYNAGGNVAAVTFNGTEYYYLRNAQGDIVKLIDASGAAVVEYTYDTWGKKVNVTGSLAGTLGALQPFRYRGYVYDEETSLYYLQSRYYDPEVGRFISADVLLSTGQGVMGHDAYAYCLGNPVNNYDDGGMQSTELDDDDDRSNDCYREAGCIGHGGGFSVPSVGLGGGAGLPPVGMGGGAGGDWGEGGDLVGSYGAEVGAGYPNGITNFYYDSQNAAMRAAKRSENIPLSMNPTESIRVVIPKGQNGRYYETRIQVYGDKYIRNDYNGHLFRDGDILPRHYNAGLYDGTTRPPSNGKHFYY